MNPNNGNVIMGAIPRKKRPVLPMSLPSAPPPASSIVALNAPIPRRPSAQPAPPPAAASAVAARPKTTASSHPVKKKKSFRPTTTTTSTTSTSPPPPPWIQKMIDEPLLLRIHTAGMSTFASLEQQQQAAAVIAAAAARSSRAAVQKRPRSAYKEDTDSENNDFLMDTDDEELEQRKLLEKRRKRAKTASAATTATTAAASTSELQDGTTTTTAAASLVSSSCQPPLAANPDGAPSSQLFPVTTSGLVVDPNAIEAPPPGSLSSLWYSRECFLHVFVLDKICGWKTRPTVVFKPTTVPQSPTTPVTTGDAVTPTPTLSSPTTQQAHDAALPRLDAVQAQTLATQLLQSTHIWADARKRMEVSRIHPATCPVVMTLFAAQHQIPSFLDHREEVVLVKWRGRSHLHCSWERAADVQRLDTSNNSTARHKIRRFYQQQEVALGPAWKQVLEEERRTAARIHSHGKTTVAAVVASTTNTTTTDAALPESAVVVDDDGAAETEEYFLPQCLEIERILACDESQMNMHVLAKQRAINIHDEQEAMRLKEETATATTSLVTTAASSSSSTITGAPAASGEVLLTTSKPVTDHMYHILIQPFLQQAQQQDEWDPEDNVRYVVKWKGLPYAEMTWEYWRDIKSDAVDEAEDFWHRQVAPGDALVSVPKAHPHMQDFRKLQESPRYGISNRERPVADLSSSSSSADAMLSSFSTGEDDEGDASGFRLRSYQLEGVNWLLFNWWNKRSCILADEMGLGKTIQSAAFLRELQSQQATQIRGPFLIVAPLSLVGQWQSELHSWAPDMNVVLYHGSADAREFLVQQEFYYTDQFVPKPVAAKLKKKHITKFHVLITTYEVVLKDAAVMSRIRWKVLIVDEAHRLKNPKARLFEQLANVPRDYCVLLTGTPIANATEELWALLHFCNPTVFTDKEGFLERFGEMTDAKQVNELHTLLRPYLLRRVKEDVEKSLPPKEETILEVSLTPIQKTFYKAIYERNTSFLYKGVKPSNAPSLMNVMMELRKCCNHPYLVKGAEDRILADAAAKLKEKGHDTPVDYIKLFGEQLVQSSGKMVLMEKLLQKLFIGGHKVLVFSQMVRVLDLLEELLKIKKYRYERLDGSTSSSSRAHAVDRFGRKSCQRFVMLLSTRAGGLGLNLTAADIVIIFDSDWNPQNDLQAMARAHRIGQTRAVRVYRLLTAKTYEMHMFHSASLKLGLERAVLSQNREQGEESGDDNKSKKKSAQAQAKEIDELLKKGAYDVFRDDDDAEAEKFMETDIDQLLEHSSKKVTYGASATASLGSGLGSFSKASFVANTDGGEKDVDLDDPDFWSKAVGIAPPEETPEEVAQMIDDGVKRSRKQVQVYDPYADTAEAEKRKKERIELEKMLEQEEKERLKMEKRMKKNEAKQKKRSEREQEKTQKLAVKQQAVATRVAEGQAKKVAAVVTVPKDPRPPPKPKKSKKSERQRALRRAENTDPVLERLKQAWEVPQRNRATAAAIRFGFSRFCKIRSESNLTGLPLQDLECFFRSYVYQLGLQVAVMLLELLKRGYAPDLRSVLQEWFGAACNRELGWICDSIQSAMKLQLDVESSRRFLRMPVILAEPSYVRELRQGAALRALRRIGVLARLNRIIEDCLDTSLSGLGHEELGRRGCIAGDLSALDPDLKSRLVTTEELGLVVGSFFRRMKLNPPASWWDRSCDVALVIGSFVHGLGNYEAMRSAFDLPIADKILKAAQREKGCTEATRVFRSAQGAARQVFDDALESARVKAELEVQAAVAAALKASLKREEDAALLRKGGAEAEAVISSMPDTQVEDAFAFDGTDSHFVTLPRMLTYIHAAVHKEAISIAAAPQKSVTGPVSSPLKTDSEEGEDGTRVREHEVLPMPDARVLDHRLLCILDEIESVAYPEDKSSVESGDTSDLWIKSGDVQTNIDVRTLSMSSFICSFADFEGENSGIGIGSNQCGSSHRSLNDGSDFGFGSACTELAHVAYGTDAPRYLRALGVPMNVTRFAVTGLVHADASCVKQLLISESLRYYGKEDATGVSRIGSGEASATPTDPQSEAKKDPPIVQQSATSPLSKGEPKHDGPGGKANTTSIEAQIEPKNDLSSSEADTTLTRLQNVTETELSPGETNATLTELPSDPKIASSSTGHLSAASSGPQSEAKKDQTSGETNGTAKETKIGPNKEGSAGRAKVTSMESQRELKSSDRPDKPDGVDPVERMLPAFRQNAKLRANVCCAVLLYGFPSKIRTNKKIHPALSVSSLTGIGNGDSSDDLFDEAKFRGVLVKMDPDLEVPDVDALFTYIETFLIPHCLRLCVSGNGATTRNARGSHGDYATAFGVSVHPEPSQSHPSPIPDPCISLHEHSLEALGHANALLRRVRLLRSCVFLCSGNQIPVSHITEVTRTDIMGSLEDMPVWWCPWIHDLALLAQAASGGLFSVLPTRSEHAIFSPKAVQDHLYSSFLANEKALPPASRTSLESVTAWTRAQSKAFPSLYQLERRLAFLCARTTAQIEHEARYDNVPMFDHGGWPRN